MPRFRLLPIVITILLVTFTVRLGDFAVELFTGQHAEIKSASALANEEAAEEGKKEDAKKDDKKAPERAEIPAPVSATEVKGMEKDPEEDPFMQEFSDEEIKVLQSLSKRREQIDQRERDLNQREQLLKAAEKKVDEKVAELDKLKKEIEGLLDNQSKIQDESVKQLVKIYENMKPKDAATIFNDMDFDVLLSIINNMSERKVSPILAAMDPVRAREVSARIAEQKSLPKKVEAPAN